MKNKIINFNIYFNDKENYIKYFLILSYNLRIKDIFQYYNF